MSKLPTDPTVQLSLWQEWCDRAEAGTPPGTILPDTRLPARKAPPKTVAIAKSEGTPMLIPIDPAPKKPGASRATGRVIKAAKAAVAESRRPKFQFLDAPAAAPPPVPEPTAVGTAEKPLYDAAWWREYRAQRRAEGRALKQYKPPDYDRSQHADNTVAERSKRYRQRQKEKKLAAEVATKAEKPAGDDGTD